VSTRKTPTLFIKRSLAPAYILSLIIALLMAIAAVAGLLFPDTIYPTEEVLLAFLPVDLFHLIAGLPILLVSMWLARRGKLAGLLLWPGVLLYVLYNYVLSLMGVPFGALFLVYLLLVPLSAYAAIVLMSAIDAKAVSEQLAGNVPRRTTGSFLVVVTSLFVLMAVGGILDALISQEEVSRLQQILWIADLATISPACLAGGVLLLRRKPLGYTGATGLLLAYSMLFFGLVPVMIFPTIYNGTQVDTIGLGMMVGLGTTSLMLLVLFLRGTVERDSGDRV
jgi:hypothetical protein